MDAKQNKTIQGKRKSLDQHGVHLLHPHVHLHVQARGLALNLPLNAAKPPATCMPQKPEGSW